MPQRTQTAENFSAGIIEGYYGTPWSEKERGAYPRFLKECGYSFFIYCPKNDPALRKAWKNRWNREYEAFIKRTADAFKKEGIRFGVGFTPEGDASEVSLERKKISDTVRMICDACEPDMMALLFDDLKNNDGERLAECQLSITDSVKTSLAASSRLIVCPSYYSTDPVLELVFGARPDNYWPSLASELAADIDLFWTGKWVCSEEYSRDHLKWFGDTFGRKPFIWDNYPVNDGRKLADFLFFKPFSGRNWLPEFAAGSAVNPMREPYLGMLTLATLQRDLAWDSVEFLSEEHIDMVSELAGENFARLFARDARRFAAEGLSSINEKDRKSLAREYRAIGGNFAEDAARYLEGQFKFDPACLTG